MEAGGQQSGATEAIGVFHACLARESFKCEVRRDRVEVVAILRRLIAHHVRSRCVEILLSGN
eukprot:7391584-Prymnesium_polylepis.1